MWCAVTRRNWLSHVCDTITVWLGETFPTIPPFRRCLALPANHARALSTINSSIDRVSNLSCRPGDDADGSGKYLLSRNVIFVNKDVWIEFSFPLASGRNYRSKGQIALQSCGETWFATAKIWFRLANIHFSITWIDFREFLTKICSVAILETFSCIQVSILSILERFCFSSEWNQLKKR